MGLSIKEQLARKRAEREATASGRSAPATSTAPRGILYGSGIRTRAVDSAIREFDKSQQTGHHLGVVPNGETLDELMHFSEVESLVDPNIKLDPSQTAAVQGLLHQQFGCIIGKAGTGKTTTTKFLVHEILQEFERTGRDLDIAFCAFTGRAVQQIKRALPREFHGRCDTIHGLLEYAPEDVEVIDTDGNLDVRRRFIPHRTANMPLSQNVIIMDETGMTPIDLWNNLMAACKPDTRIYLLGDIYQLPPVHGRSVLGFAMLQWPTFELDRIHRTDNDAITQGAWDIMNGKMPSAAPGSVALKRISDGSTTAYREILATVQHLTQQDVFHPLRDGLIVPQNREQLGQETLNERLCSYFNPPRKLEGITVNPRTIITAGYTHVSYAIGDKVMVTQNNREQGLTNGMVGVIESIVPNPRFRGESVGDMAMAHMDADAEFDFTQLGDALGGLDNPDDPEETADIRERQASHIITVKFQNVDELIDFSAAGSINSLIHAYAFTCHKSQGGEYPVVLIVVHSANLRMLTREWLYTAWTRAKEKVILLYNSRGIQQALNRQEIRGKTLAEKAEAFIKIQSRQAMGDESAKTPILPDACEL